MKDSLLLDPEVPLILPIPDTDPGCIDDLVIQPPDDPPRIAATPDKDPAFWSKDPHELLAAQEAVQHNDGTRGTVAALLGGTSVLGAIAVPPLWPVALLGGAMVTFAVDRAIWVAAWRARYAVEHSVAIRAAVLNTFATQHELPVNQRQQIRPRQRLGRVPLSRKPQ